MDAGSRAGAQRSSSPLPVKPGVSGVDESWLRDFDEQRSEYLLRLETDRSIVDELREAGFAGAHYTYFTSELAKYALAVMTAWIRTHQIFNKMKLRGMGGLKPPPGDLLRDETIALELAGETVAYAVKNFRIYVLIPGKWDPSRGASVRTYFIGQCLIQFANVYRRWLQETVEPELTVEMQNEAVRVARGYEHVENRVSELVGTDAALRAVKKTRTKEMLVLRGAGLTHEEIASRLGLTVKTVEMAVANERKRQQRGRAG